MAIIRRSMVTAFTADDGIRLRPQLARPAEPAPGLTPTPAGPREQADDWSYAAYRASYARHAYAAYGREQDHA